MSKSQGAPPGYSEHDPAPPNNRGPSDPDSGRRQPPNDFIDDLPPQRRRPARGFDDEEELDGPRHSSRQGRRRREPSFSDEGYESGGQEPERRRNRGRRRRDRARARREYEEFYGSTEDLYSAPRRRRPQRGNRIPVYLFYPEIPCVHQGIPLRAIDLHALRELHALTSLDPEDIMELSLSGLILLDTQGHVFIDARKISRSYLHWMLDCIPWGP
ncbi:hypothetical protein FQN57_004195 [Myotisia sp. PD_48]|nr:hypothetical protein FQN57_004195 [Myotisia sp. PD_48]